MKTRIFSRIGLLLAVTCTLFCSGCMKEFLDIKRDKSQVVPVSLDDFQAFFDHLNLNFFYPYQLGEIGSDDFYLSNDAWQAITVAAHKNAYIWADEIYQGESSTDWNRGYEKILYANFVLERVDEIVETPENKVRRNELIGAAYFFRGTNLFLLAQLFCKQYDPGSAESDLGLPLRTTSNINVEYQRASLEDTYTQIIEDLSKAAELLPNELSVNTRPHRAAATGMLATVYLQRGEYQSARSYANEVLSTIGEIIDYNNVDVDANTPFPLYGQGNKEIIFYSQMDVAAILLNSRLTIDSALYESYENDDLRKRAFFFDNDGRKAYKGSYAGMASYMFSGLTIPELILVRSECNVRLGELEAAVADLNHLLSNRFASEYFKPIETNITQRELLEIVLSERRKELVYRGRRWHDLKRFGKDPSLAKPLRRVLNGIEYVLPINSPKWIWPIPPDAISQGNYIQNER